MKVTFTNPETRVSVGQSWKLASDVKNDADAAVGDVAVAFVSSDESVATVDARGVVTGQKAGRATITATVDGYLAREPGYPTPGYPLPEYAVVDGVRVPSPAVAQGHAAERSSSASCVVIVS